MGVRRSVVQTVRLGLGEKLGRMGLGYYQAWVFVVAMGMGVVDPCAADLFNPTQVRMLLSGLGAVAMVAAMFVEHSLDVLGKGRWLVCLAGCASAMGTLLFCQSFEPYRSWFLCVAGTVLISIGNALLVLAWIDYLSSVARSEQLCCILATWLTAGMIGCAVSFCPLWARQVLAVALPMLCAVTFMLTTERACRPPEPQGPPLLLDGQPWRVPLTRVLAACLCVSFALGAARTLPRFTTVMRDPLIYLLVAACVAVLMAVSKVTADKTPMTVAVYRFCLPVLTVSYLVLPFVPQGMFEPAVALLLSASFLFEMLAWLVCPLVVVLRRDHGGIYLFGWGATAIHVGSLLGFVAGDVVAGSLDDATRLQATCLVSGCILVLVMAYVLREQGLADLFAFTKPPVDGAVSATDASRVLATCSELSGEFGLSGREEQILALLAQGRSIPYVSDALGISTSTAKTHARHIYQKIGVHTKQELLDLFV